MNYVCPSCRGDLRTFSFPCKNITKRFRIQGNSVEPVSYGQDYHRNTEFRAFRAVQQRSFAVLQVLGNSLAASLKEYGACGYIHAFCGLEHIPYKRKPLFLRDLRFYDTNAVYLSKTKKYTDIYIGHEKHYGICEWHVL